MLARAKLAHLEEKVRSAQARQEWETTNGKDNNKEPSPLVLRLPQLQLAEAELFSAEKAAELAEANLQRTELLAPYDGVLTEKLADLGQVVSGGPGVPVARAYSTDSLEVMLPVSSREIDFVDFLHNLQRQLPPILEGKSGLGTLGSTATRASKQRYSPTPSRSCNRNFWWRTQKA